MTRAVASLDTRNHMIVVIGSFVLGVIAAVVFRSRAHAANDFLALLKLAVFPWKRTIHPPSPKPVAKRAMKAKAASQGWQT